jgi:hypothetical protein
VFFPPEPNSKIKIYKYCSNGEYYADSGEYEEELWDETSENIIAYIKDIFPKDKTNENDMRFIFEKNLKIEIRVENYELCKSLKVKIKLKIVALRRGCYEATISPVSWSTQPISGR